MKYEVIEKDGTKNIIVADLDFVSNNYAEFIEIIETPIIENLVPQEVTPRQARLALLQVTLLDDVELLLVNDKAMQIWWEYSLDIQRNHEHIIAMGVALNLTGTQLDDLFILAGTL